MLAVGDRLAEELYRAFCNASGIIAGSGDVPNWASMPAAQRDVWEQVAVAARRPGRRRMAELRFEVLDYKLGAKSADAINAFQVVLDRIGEP